MISFQYLYVKQLIAEEVMKTENWSFHAVTAASLGATLVLMIAIFTVIIIKLQKDKANLRRLTKSMTDQSSFGITVKRDINQEYENSDQKAAKLWRLKSMKTLHILLLKICKLRSHI